MFSPLNPEERDCTCFYPVKPVIAVLAVVGAGMAALMGATAAGLFFRPSSNLVRLFIFWIGAAFFLLAAISLVGELFRQGPVVEVSPDGIRFVRFSPEIIPWASIERVSLRHVGRFGLSVFVVLHLKNGAQNKFERSVRQKIQDACNAAFGFQGVDISMIGTSGTAYDLLEAIDLAAPRQLVRPEDYRGKTDNLNGNLPADHDDPNYLLRKPPAKSQVMIYNGRRVVILSDGRVVAEMLAGDARRFASFEEFEDFIR